MDSLLFTEIELPERLRTLAHLQVARSRHANQPNIGTQTNVGFSKKALNHACELVIREPLTRNQPALMTDA